MVAFNFAPMGWALCQGQILPLSQNTALFSLLGTTYGGNGTTNFALPNFQAMAPMGYGQGSGLSNRTWGETGGEYTVPLQTTQIAAHNHNVGCDSGAAADTTAANNVWASTTRGTGTDLYAAAATAVPMNNTAAVQLTGGGQPHNNLPPFLSVYFVIALQGIYPTRS